MTEKPLCLRPRSGSALVLTCEHASPDVPPRLGDLGLSDEQRRDHIGWDVGAATVADEISQRLSVPAVLSTVSRLVVDCNRRVEDRDLIPVSSHGVVIPGNEGLDAEERRARLRDYYDPYHREIDDLLERSAAARLLSIHSFTPDFEGRDFDVGVLFDDHEDHAERIAVALLRAGFRVRMNEPYSGFAGLIYSARSHGRRFGRHYLEIEINNALLRSEAAARAIAAKLVAAVAAFANGQD
jgi:predicted N-formylglutamate amidohydrolase